MDILGGIAFAFLILAGTGVAMRRAGSPARYPGRARSRANPAGVGRGAAWPNPRKSWLVTAAKSAGVKLKSDHLGGASAELAGMATGSTFRAGGRLAGRGGQLLATVAGRRWQARGETVRQPLILHRPQPEGGGDPQPGAARGPEEETTVTVDSGPGTGPAAARHVPGHFEPGDAPWEVLKTGSLSMGEDGNLHMSGWNFRDPHPPPDGKPGIIRRRGTGGADALYGHSLAGLHALSHGDGCDCPVSRVRVAPGPVLGGGSPTPSVPATPGRAGKKENSVMRQRHVINLERPSTDGEFLESCVQLADVLKALAEEVADWADSLGGLNLPQSVLAPLHQVSEGINEAATGASQAAKAFEDEFEDARDVASRGMHFTGQDAA